MRKINNCRPNDIGTHAINLVHQVMLAGVDVKEILMWLNEPLRLQALKQVNAVGNEFLVEHDGSLRVLVGKFPDGRTHVTSSSSYRVVCAASILLINFQNSERCVQDLKLRSARLFIIVVVAVLSRALVFTKFNPAAANSVP